MLYTWILFIVKFAFLRRTKASYSSLLPAFKLVKSNNFYPFLFSLIQSNRPTIFTLRGSVFPELQNLYVVCWYKTASNSLTRYSEGYGLCDELLHH